ncbi:type VII toxin-antitoxin system MntA family adenylyltransferase antitoxin [Clostridium sp. B9]|uniref:type VII toxin-antitoxin system MntA family adenylyltransferase antitoxin n=1 Tax=Clostridium sp. B9 TaxID=3423224 RepID=UPI003D2F0CB2
MMSNDEIKKEIIRILDRKDIDAVYIFGSFLTKRFQESSDIDIAILGEISLEDTLYMESVLEEALSREIDLVKLEDLEKPIQLQVISRNKRLVFKETELVKNFLNELDKWYK